MTSLQDLIQQCDVPTKPLEAGDKVLFERSDDSGSFSINLGVVQEIRSQGEFKEPQVIVKGIHTFFPDGSNQPHRGRTPWRFPVSQFNTSILERLEQRAKQLEERASQMRSWIKAVVA